MALVTGVGVWLLDLPLGAAVLLGAILAPTDPVLASDVQVEHPFDSNPLRFSLTGEAGWNDGTAFPFVMLGPWDCSVPMTWAGAGGAGSPLMCFGQA